ncbi:MAG: hypothetical protein WC029_03905 [Sulfuricella sp.]|jgi:hypothetical protein
MNIEISLHNHGGHGEHEEKQSWDICSLAWKMVTLQHAIGRFNSVLSVLSVPSVVKKWISA